MPKRRAGAAGSHRGKPAGMPPPSRLFSTRESATSNRRFRPERARSSPGLPPLQGALPPWIDDGLHRVSPHEVTRTADKSTDWTPYRVSLPERLAGLSRDCRPSWGSPPCDSPRKFGLAAVRESPPQAPGCVTAPSPSHL
jgi:hypothetical protein